MVEVVSDGEGRFTEKDPFKMVDFGFNEQRRICK